LLSPGAGAQIVVDALFAMAINCFPKANPFHGLPLIAIEAATRPLIHSLIED